VPTIEPIVIDFRQTGAKIHHKDVLWDESKHELLKSSRGVSFEMVVEKIKEEVLP
jgi:hypothetical protein